MALCFARVIGTGKRKHYADDFVLFPDNIRAYLTEYANDFSSGVTLLLGLDEYSDTPLYENKIKQLLQLCAEIQKITNNYNTYGKCKSFGIKKEELLMFANHLSKLLQFALDNGEIVYAIGD